MKSSARLLGLGVLLLVLGGCNRRETAAPPGQTVADGAAPPAEVAPAEPAVDDGGFRSTAINPTRPAQLTSQTAGAQINLRSQPTTQSESRGYGLSGDNITLMRLAEGEDGLSWYYVTFAQSGAEGWVRGDFVDTSVQATAPDLAPGTAPDISTGPCGDNRPEAFFETQSFALHLCQTPQGLSYIGVNKASNETLTTADVTLNQGTYIAINGNTQYHINDRALTVYRVSRGSYEQLDNEAVIRHERFLY